MSQEYTVYKKFTTQDYATHPFNANKQYTFLNSASAATNKIDYFSSRWTSESIDTYSSNSVENQKITDTINTIQYNQLDHLYYKNWKRDLGNRFGDWHYVNQRRELNKDVNIISIPAGHYGHSIKKGTFKIEDTVKKVILVDDSKGNLIVKDTDVSNYNIDIKENIFKLGPVKGFKKYDLSVYDGYVKINPYQTIPYYRKGEKNQNPPSSYTTPELGDEFDDSYYFNLIKYKNVNFAEKSLGGIKEVSTLTLGASSTTLMNTSSLQDHGILNSGSIYVEIATGDDFTLAFDTSTIVAPAGTTTGTDITTGLSGSLVKVDLTNAALDGLITASDLAQATMTAVNTISGFTASVSTNIVTITAEGVGTTFNISTTFPSATASVATVTEGVNASTGLYPCINFNGIDSEVKKANDEKFHFNKDDEFTISFWASVSQSAAETSYLISKSTTKTIIPSPTTGRTGLFKTLSSSNSAQTLDVNAGSVYPFEIYVKNGTNSPSPHIFFDRKDKDNSKIISASFTTGSDLQHVTCTRSKTGNMEIFINGIGTGISGSDNLKTTQNNANLYIGNKGGKSNFLSGSLSNINIYNKTLTDTQILNHYSSSNGSPYIGNIFYSHGIATITHPDYKTFLSGSSVIQEINYQGNHLIYENEYQCSVDEGEFNDTLNISARKNRSNQSSELEDFATGSLFKPYITTIGLYNDNKELLLVGKLGQPLRTSNETDTTIVLRWDT